MASEFNRGVYSLSAPATDVQPHLPIRSAGLKADYLHEKAAWSAPATVKALDKLRALGMSSVHFT
jgi:hypothetical protein